MGTMYPFRLQRGGPYEQNDRQMGTPSPILVVIQETPYILARLNAHFP